ncbi:hypothetical protein ACLOJK_004766 [Asimina triloba]
MASLRSSNSSRHSTPPDPTASGQRFQSFSASHPPSLPACPRAPSSSIWPPASQSSSAHKPLDHTASITSVCPIQQLPSRRPSQPTIQRPRSIQAGPNDHTPNAFACVVRLPIDNVPSSHHEPTATS